MFANRLNRIGKCSLRSGIPTCLSPGPQFSLTEGNAAYDGRGRTTTDGCGRKLSISLAVLLRRVGNVRTADTRSWTNAEIAIYSCSISAYNPIKESNISFEHNSQSISLRCFAYYVPLYSERKFVNIVYTFPEPGRLFLKINSNLYEKAHPE